MRKMVKKIKTNQSGITLISLVVTIILLIILATVGINTGISTYNSAKLTQFTTQMKLMQLEVNELYEKYITEGVVELKDGRKYKGEAIANLGEELSFADQGRINKVFQTAQNGGSDIVDSDGYRFFDHQVIEGLEIEGIEQEFLVNIPKRKVISYKGLKYNNVMYYTLEQLPDSLYNVDYVDPNTGKPVFDISYEELVNGIWKITVSNIRYKSDQQGFVAKWKVKYQDSHMEEDNKWYTSENLSFIVDRADKYNVFVFQEEVQSEVAQIEIKVNENVVPGEVVTGGNKEYSDGTDTAVIPEGFKVSEVETEQKIDTGLVVIAPDESEFVWVPVDKNTLCADGVEGKEVAEISSGEDYRGVLYDFSGTTSSKIAYSDDGYREPDVVVGSDGNDYDADTEYLNAMNNILGTTFADSDDFKEYMQEEYNNIIDSIKANGGFYVGRYESSLSSSTKTQAGTTGNIQSKKEIMPTAASNSGTYSWYGLYAKQRVYVQSLTGTNVKSSMIYGSMYDAVLNWALYGDDKTDASKVTARSTKHGPEYTGALNTDKINNIYDLGNNLREWTTEADYAGNRVERGGYCYGAYSPSLRTFDSNPDYTYSSYGSRLLLYV